jgi:hypothetical protein
MCKTETICCYECGKEIQDHEAIYHIGEEYICEDCRDAYYMYCEDCDNLARNDDVFAVDNRTRYVCGDCSDKYYTCDHCYNLFSDHRIAINTIQRTLCVYCYEDYYFACEGCGEVYNFDDGEYIDGCYYCRSCAEDNRGCILSYGTKPTPVFFGGAKAGYGVELEIDDGNSRQNAAMDIQAAGLDHVYLKEDGSLSYKGMEIVTHPATLDYHVNDFPWTDICDAALDYGYRSHDTDTCGLHIHASRSLFGDSEVEQDLTIAKIMLLVDRWYDDYIVRFARRNLAKMRRWADKPNVDIQPGDNDTTAVSKSKNSAGDRYKAVNLCNYSTVEFRFFKGTLKRDTIIASIQWVDTIINYCKATDLKNLWASSWDEIFGNTEHAELTNYLKQRNLYNIKEEN